MAPKFVTTFTVPPDFGTSAVHLEDGGQAAIMEQSVEDSGPDEPNEEGGDGKFFVRLQSWDDEARRNNITGGLVDGKGHEFMQSLMGKLVRVTVEVIE